MPQRDLDHHAVVHALEKDGWTITNDPFRLEYGRRNLYVDLGAENLLAAEKDQRRIAVEIKGFAGAFAYEEVFSDKLGQLVIRQQQLRLIVYEEEEQEIVRWLP